MISDKSVQKISSRLFDWGFDIWEQNRGTWTKKEHIEFESTWSLLKRIVKKYKKQQEALDYVEAWLNTNMDEPPPEGIQEDSANLLQKMKELLQE